MSDLIRRDEAIEVIECICNTPCNQYFVNAVKSIPSVEPKVGKWEECKVVDIEDTTITEVQSAFCPICRKYHTTPYMYYFDYFNYCPNCGTKMERSE